jgi:hypothetical protein
MRDHIPAGASLLRWAIFSSLRRATIAVVLLLVCQDDAITQGCATEMTALDELRRCAGHLDAPLHP